MDLNLALILVVLTAVTGVIWLIDTLFFLPGRRRRAAEVVDISGLSEEERRARFEMALREPTLTEYARSFFPVLLVILVVRSFIAEPFKIPSGSMMPTLIVGDFILVNKFAYGLRLPVLNKKIVSIGEPERGDVFVFRYPQDPKVDYIKRVIGLPGDEIRYQDKNLFVNGVKVEADYIGPYTGPSEPGGRSMAGGQVFNEKLTARGHQMMNLPEASSREGVWTVPEGQYFAMGDNRDNSLDSRYWGFVPEANLVGRAMVVWMNYSGGIDFGRIGTVIR